ARRRCSWWWTPPTARSAGRGGVDGHVRGAVETPGWPAVVGVGGVVVAGPAGADHGSGPRRGRDRGPRRADPPEEAEGRDPAVPQGEPRLHPLALRRAPAADVPAQRGRRRHRPALPALPAAAGRHLRGPRFGEAARRRVETPRADGTDRGAGQPRR